MVCTALAAVCSARRVRASRKSARVSLQLVLELDLGTENGGRLEDKMELLPS
jgi:hypothetical protein